MRREIKDIIENDVVIPDIVLKAKENAFSQIPDDVENMETRNKETFGKSTSLNKSKSFRKRWVAIAAVAVLAVGSLSVSASTGVFDELLTKFMGISEEDLSEIQVAKENAIASDTAECFDYKDNQKGIKDEVTATVSELVGDSNSAYFRVDFDYELPDDFDPEKDWIISSMTGHEFFDDEECMIKAENPEDISGQYYYEDGKLSIVYRYTDLEKINSKYVRLTIHDIVWFDRENLENHKVLCDGEWQMTFKLDYEAADPIVYDKDFAILVEDAEFEKTDGTRAIRDTEVVIHEITLSPLNINIEATADYDPEEEIGMFLLYSIDKITMKDGAEIVYDYDRLWNGEGDYKYNAWFESTPQTNTVYSYMSLGELFGQGVNLDKVKSITINGQEIKLK